MIVDHRNIWQIAAGDTNRSYPNLCLRWGVILYGPGGHGLWPDNERLLRDDGWGTKRINLIRKFQEGIKAGDLVVLRLGTSEVYGVGEVVGEVQWLDDFGDIDGWDIQLVRRVRWLWKATKGRPKKFETYALKWGDTIQELKRSGSVFDWLLEVQQWDCGLPELPPSCESRKKVRQLKLDEIAKYLFDEGIAAGSINDLTDNMLALGQIASWYERTNSRPSETETVTYLVVPLLRALGWTPQRMAVEWGKIDIALFDFLPRGDISLSAVVEVKKFGHSCLTAKSQGASYAGNPGREGCARLIVTDGIRYGIYVKGKDEKGNFPDVPTAYLNLTRLVEDYPILECKGAPKALTCMASDWRHT